MGPFEEMALVVEGIVGRGVEPQRWRFAVCAVRDDPQTTIIEIVCDGARLLLWGKISPLSAVNSHRPAPGVMFR